MGDVVLGLGSGRQVLLKKQTMKFLWLSILQCLRETPLATEDI